MKKIFTVLAGILLLSQAAQAAEDPKLVGTYGDWKAYSFVDGADTVCFMSAAPTEQKGMPKNKKRGDVLLFITHWASEKTKNVVSVSLGYPIKADPAATIKVDGKSFKMTSDSETAWSKDQATDDALTAAIRQGSKLTVEGTSKRGTKTEDIYDLKGSADAYAAISKECNFQ